MCDVKGLVSITIPFFNSDRFLAEAIESVLAQTYADWELFLVDDGSTDGSSEIAREYAARVPAKIRCLEHDGHCNRGVNCSRNLGARVSKGEYLAFLDSDDVWRPHKLSDQVALMNTYAEIGLLYGHSEYWYDWDVNRGDGQDNYIPSLAPGGDIYRPPALFAKSYPLGDYGAPCPSSFLVRRTAFDSVNGFDECFNPKTYQVYEDTAFLTKINLNVPVFVSDCCWEEYRCHSGSAWHQIDGTYREESARRFYFQWLREYLSERNVTDPVIWKAVRKKAWMYSIPLPAFFTKYLRRAVNRLLRE
jgi:glycosyltransferase involved in cell wall biosynthesis